MAILIGIGCIVLLEIAAMGALLWLYFWLDEWHPKFKLQLKECLELLQVKREFVASIEEILLNAKYGQSKAIGKWAMISKTVVTLFEKLAEVAKYA